MGEPLWRVKTKPFVGSDRSYIGFTELDVPGFTEVEVWPAGDRTKAVSGEWQTYLATNGWVILDKDSQFPVCITKSDTADEMVRSLVETHNKAIRAGGDRTPTREQIWHAIANRLNGRPISNVEIDKATDGVWVLLHGEGDETGG